MDATTRGHVVTALRWLSSELQKGAQCQCGNRVTTGLAHVPMELAAVVVTGRPASGCEGCGGPVEQVRRGRPRKYCETCHAPRRASNKRTQKAA